jgi:hypothetical protein
MKVIAVPLARCMWLMDFDKINPRGRSLLDAFHALAKRYRFAKFPAHVLDFGEGGGLKFASGEFRNKGIDIRVGLTVFDNGFQADTLSSTDDAEAFLEDMRQWLEKKFNLPIEDEAIIRKSYQSQLDVKFSKELVLVNPKIAPIANRLSSQSTSIDGKQREFFIGGISLFPEDAGNTGVPLPFKLERKWGKPFAGDNTYFAQAQLRTSEHVEILEEIEKTCSRD